MNRHSWNYPVALALLLGLLAGPVQGQNESPPASLAELQERLGSLVSQPRFAAGLWGIKIVSLDTGKTLFEQNPGKLLSPASNAKLFTVALALDRLGPGFRIKTSLYAKARPDAAGTIAGDLLLYGRGDPTLNARLHEGDLFKALRPLVVALTNAGVKRIAGDVVADASFIRGPEFGSGWAWDDQEYSYGAEVSALSINDNTLQVTVKPGDQLGAPARLSLSPATSFLTLSNRTVTVAKGGRRSVNFYRNPGENLFYVTGQTPLEDTGLSEDLPFHNPPALFGTFLFEALKRQGLVLDGKLRTVDWLARAVDPFDPSRWVELAALESLPVRDLAREVLKPSQNLYADLLLAQVGESRRTADTPADRTSEDLGIHELTGFLAEAGVPRGEVQFEEGSGLSRDNLATPNAIVTLLAFMSRHPCAEVFAQALPIAGVDGSLKTRMKGTPAAGKLRAKTGSLHWANSLSGYLTTTAGEHLVFCFMLNRYHAADANHSARAELDALAVTLASWTGRSE